MYLHQFKYDEQLISRDLKNLILFCSCFARRGVLTVDKRHWKYPMNFPLISKKIKFFNRTVTFLPMQEIMTVNPPTDPQIDRGLIGKLHLKWKICKNWYFHPLDISKSVIQKISTCIIKSKQSTAPCFRFATWRLTWWMELQCSKIQAQVNTERASKESIRRRVHKIFFLGSVCTVCCAGLICTFPFSTFHIVLI